MNRSLIAVLLLLAGAEARAQGLFVFSGNGQIVQESFRSTAPLVVQARDAAGNPMAGVAITWEITDGQGTLISPLPVTDEQGLAQVEFVATLLVPLGSAWVDATITASSAEGSADFIITAARLRGLDGSTAPPPLAEMVEPPLGDPRLSGAAGSMLSGAVVIRVSGQAAPQAGQPVPNVGVRMVNANDPSAPVPVSCNGPEGLVLTGADGIAVCDLVLGTMPGNYRVSANVGELWITRSFRLEITEDVQCSYLLTPTGQTFGTPGSTGVFGVTAAPGCAWTAMTTENWINITAGTTGNGNGQVSFNVAANPGGSRSGVITVAGETFTVTQQGVGGGGGGQPTPLAIVNTGLPEAQVGMPYSVVLGAAGGQPPYSWSQTGPLPGGFTINAVSGMLSGTPVSPGNVNVPVMVTDGAGATATRNFTLVIASGGEPPPDGFIIVTAGFPSGTVGADYTQPIITSGGCVSPFNPPDFTVISGGLPPGLTFGFGALRGTPTAAGTYSFTVEARDACGVTASRSYTVQILGGGGGPAPVLNVVPVAFAFEVRSGGQAPSAQGLSVTAGDAVSFTAAAATATGGDWLVVSPAAGTTPMTLMVSVQNFNALPAGNYSGTITLSAAGTGTASVAVTMTVLQAVRLEPSPVSMAFTFAPNEPRTTQQTLRVTSGGVPKAFTADVQIFVGGGWLRLNASAGTTPGALSVLIDAADLVPGTYGAAIVLTADGDSVSVPVTIDVQPPPELLVSPLLVSFRFQEGVPPPGPRLITLASNGAALDYNLAVDTDSGGAWLFAQPGQGTTPQGVAISVNPVGLDPGAYRGQLMIVDASGGAPSVAVTVELTIAGPAPSLTAVTNAASYLENPLAPGEIVVAFGVDLGPAVLVVAEAGDTDRLPKELAGTKVLFNGEPGALLFTSGNQVGAIVPYALTTLAADRIEVVVEFQGERSNPVELDLADASPGIFTIGGASQGAILNQDGSVNGDGNGAAAGEIVSIFATGEGETDPPGEDGKLAGDPLPQPLLEVVVEIDGQPAEVTYAGSAPKLTAGALQVNAQIPAGARTGVVTIVLRVGQFVSQEGVTLVIR
ncbi:MAG: hypothetical protein GY953_34690 [bacterium]|nr:hypothetical protein [bacterium]